MKKIVFIILLIVNGIFAQAQKSQIPLFLEYKQAIDAGTRTLSGIPGVNYWQNEVSYDLAAEIDVTNSHLFGSGLIVFKNNSPDTLNEICINLYQNLYAKGNIRGIQIKKGDIGEGVNIKDFLINGKKLNLEDKKKVRFYGTSMNIKLDSLLVPGGRLTINTIWNYHIPEYTYLRQGRTDSTTYFIGYWYPQVAVYDDIHGWDTQSYNGLHEFYNEFASFKVAITVPPIFGVWATGELQNAKNIFGESLLQKYQKAKIGSDKITLISKSDILNHQLLFKENVGKQTWKFEAEHVNDFAFSISDHFIWEACTMTMPEGHKVFVQTAYRPEALDFVDMLDGMKEYLNFLSTKTPGVSYPYPSISVIEAVRDKGDGGMEFPMICNNPSSKTKSRAFDIMSHEIAHTYFPFLTGTSENRNGWIDEGFASFLPRDYMREVDSLNKRFSNYAALMGMLCGTSSDPPIFTPTYDLSASSLFNPTYAKPAIALVYLSEFIGKEKFNEIIKEFLNVWKYKHAGPYDFFYFISSNSEYPLDWFWKSWYFERTYPDLAIQDLKEVSDGFEISISNIGGMPVPVCLNIQYLDGSSEIIKYNIGLWSKRETIFVFKIIKRPEIITLGSPEIPDVDNKNNSWRK